jgi:hypothetical protein
LRTLAIALLVLVPVACGGDDGGDEGAADETTTTASSDDETTTTTEPDLTTGTTASTATEETTTTAAPVTQPPATQPPATQAPPTPTTAAGPRVTSLSASPSDCDGSGQITLTWATSGATSVEVSIDSENGTFQDGLPPSGSAQFPGACFGDTQIYFVKAIAANGTSATRSITASS